MSRRCHSPLTVIDTDRPDSESVPDVAAQQRRPGRSPDRGLDSHPDNRRLASSSQIAAEGTSQATCEPSAAEADGSAPSTAHAQHALTLTDVRDAVLTRDAEQQPGVVGEEVPALHSQKIIT